MASRFFEDLLCGALGYGIGRLQDKKLTKEDCETIVKSWLQNTSLEDVIDAWIAEGDNGWSKSSVIFNLEQKINDLKYLDY